VAGRALNAQVDVAPREVVRWRRRLDRRRADLRDPELLARGT